MGTALTHWDDAIKRYRAAWSAANGPQVHVALGSVYMDRGLTLDAVDQFRRAVTLAPGWGEASLLLGLASEALGRHDDAARAFTRAARAAPVSAAIGYARVQHAVVTGDEREISRALLEFRDRHDRAVRPSNAGTAGPLFVRFGLLRETAGTAPVFAPALYADGFRLLNARRYNEAVASLRQAVERDPLATPDAELDERLRSGAELREGNLPRAIARLEQAVARSGDSSELRRLLAAAYAADERHAQSLEQLSTAVARNTGDERSRLAVTEILMAVGQFDAAEQSLRSTIEVLPDSGRAHYVLGRLYQAESRTPEALAAFSLSADRSVLVGRDALYETIAALRVAEGEFTEAIAAYRLQIDANPNNGAAHRRLGDLYSQEGRLGESLAEFSAALLIEPRDADAHASRAQTLLRMSRFAEAETSARIAVALSPSNEGARYALGTALIRMGRTEEGHSSLQEFERLQAATRARNDSAWQLKLLKNQAAEHAARQDYRAAADLLRRAVVYAPADGSVHLAAGAILLKAGEFEQAIQLLKEAVDRDALEAHRYLADSYAALGRAEESRAHRAAYDAVKASRLRRGAAGP
jgi:tetratricopeptide (TPR) repeat protein